MKKAVERVLPPVVVLLAGIVAWQLVFQFGNLPRFVLPGPGSVVESAMRNSSAFISAALHTLLACIIGFVVAAALAIFLAVLLVWSFTLRKIGAPLIVVFQAVPKVAIAPLFVVWLGVDSWVGKIAIIVMISFYPIFVNALEGFERIRVDAYKLLIAMGSTRLQIFMRLEFPSAAVALFAGLRIASVLTAVGAILAEILGGSRGLGYLMNIGLGNLDTALMFVDLIVMTMCAMVMFYLCRVAESAFGRWTIRSGISGG